MQLKNLFRWLTHDRLEAFVASYHRVSLWVGVGAVAGAGAGERHHAVAVVNAGIDRVTGLSIALLGGKSEAIYVDRNLPEVALYTNESDGDYRLFRLPEIGAWDIGLLLT